MTLPLIKQTYLPKKVGGERDSDDITGAEIAIGDTFKFIVYRMDRSSNDTVVELELRFMKLSNVGQ